VQNSRLAPRKGKMKGSHISRKFKSPIRSQNLTFPLHTRPVWSAQYREHNSYRGHSLSSANIPPFQGPASCCFIQNRLSFWNGSSVNLRLGCASMVVGAALVMPAFRSPHTFCSSGWCWQGGLNSYSAFIIHSGVNLCATHVI
jgi:hypothetical protein